MDWSYVAGFFDGEGHLAFTFASWAPKYKGVSWCVSQAESNIAPIRALERFFRINGIQFNTRIRPAKGNTQRQFEIRINHHEHVLAVLRKTVPYLVLKRARARKAIRLIESRAWQFRKPDGFFRDAHPLYAKGLSGRDVAKKFGGDWRSYMRAWKRLGLPTRSQIEGARLWRHKSPLL